MSTKLSTRVLLMSAGLVAAVIVPTTWKTLHAVRAEEERDLAKKAAAFTAVVETTKDQAALLFESGLLDVERLFDETSEVVKMGGDYTETGLFEALPILFGWRSAEDAAQREGMDFRVRSFDARNPDNQPEVGSVEHQLLSELRVGFEQGITTAHAIDQEQNTMVFMRSVVLDESCMMCHGNPGNAWDIDGDGRDLLGFEMEGWQPGDMHGAWTVVMPLDQIDASIAGFTKATLMLVFPLVLVGLGGFYFLLRKTFARPMEHVVADIERMSRGDLSVRVEFDGEDELGVMARSLNGFLRSLDDSFMRITSGSEQIDAGSAQLAIASQNLASGTADQASSLEQISASLEQMAGMTEKNSEHAQEANRLTNTTSEAANRGNEEMARMSKAVDDIQSSSTEISKVIKVIDDIAFQTNLLALNAAVEAARAGEAGKGFAVVAEEVRNLAQRSAEAAKETAGLIEESSRRSEAGVAISVRVGQVLGEVVESVQQVNCLVGEIASASKEQAIGISQINAGVSNLERIVQQNAASAEELASTSEETSNQVVLVKQMIHRFEVSSTGRGAPPAGFPTGGFAPAAIRPSAPLAGIPLTAEEDAGFGGAFDDAGFTEDDDLASF